jgi:YfiH family protein
MISNENGKIEYFSFETFIDHKVINAVFTRTGGISPDPWSSLNQGGTTGDQRSNVVENRKRAFDVLGLKVDSIFDVWQVHGTRMIVTDKPRELDAPHEKADIIITNQPGISLFMRFADCVPIFLYDPKENVIAIVHAGWQGTVKKITQNAVRCMEQEFNSKVKNILAGIGPSIGVDHYEVNQDVLVRFKNTYHDRFDEITKSNDKKTFLDLKEANIITLSELGVGSIEVSEICTACDLKKWYSHRAENGKTGRFGALLSMPL